ncbi:MAG TPA: peptidoglycan DD-metalloendopeptidase family protein [Bacilli bacterium]|nr:peptidoglycan DD-metalloendopeptidase family protein [Bacilli bacterium]
MSTNPSRLKQATVSFLTMIMLATTLPTTGAMAQDNLQQKEQEAKQLRDQLNQLSDEQKEMQQQAEQLEAEIALAMKKSQDLRDEIAKTQARLDKRQEEFKVRLKVMYEGGDVKFWEVLFGSTDFNDFISRLNMLTLILNNDAEMMKEIQADEEKLKTDYAALMEEQKARQAKQDKLIALQQKLNARYNQLTANLQDKEAEIAVLEESTVQAYNNYQQSFANAPAFINDGGGGTYIWPMPASHTISSGYGPRWGGFHAGIDITAPVGTPIVAVADGKVIQAGPASGFGHWVVIAHSNGLLSVYGHMYANGLRVHAGQTVKQGQVIAVSGSDGESTGPHLHFSFATGISGGRMNYVNPMAYLQ